MKQTVDGVRRVGNGLLVGLLWAYVAHVYVFLFYLHFFIIRLNVFIAHTLAMPLAHL